MNSSITYDETSEKVCFVYYQNNVKKSIFIINSTDVGSYNAFTLAMYYLSKDHVQLKNTVTSLTQQVDELKAVVNDLKTTLNAVWYAPGMPGYLEARNDWNALNKDAGE